MEHLLPTTEEIAQINQSRQMVASAAFLEVFGPCSADMNRLPYGELATQAHLKDMAATAIAAAEIHRGKSVFIGRFVGEKPRTSKGQTGLIHQSGGVEAYIAMAHELHKNNVPLAAEVMDETGFLIAGRHISMAWIGARNDTDTGPRYLVRPTTQELDNDIHPLPAFAKSGLDGTLDGTVDALHTIMSDTTETRTRFTSEGIRTVTTHANPHVGVILRGSKNMPVSSSRSKLIHEIGQAKNRLNYEFGENRIPIVIDLSHAHAAYEGGGAEGQQRIAKLLAGIMLSGIQVNGIMAESYVLPGNQSDRGTVPGLSTKDKCLGHADAVRLMLSFDRLIGDMETNKATALAIN